MNGKRAKALRTEERPNPGRKHGGSIGKRKTFADIRAEHNRWLAEQKITIPEQQENITP